MAFLRLIDSNPPEMIPLSENGSTDLQERRGKLLVVPESQKPEVRIVLIRNRWILLDYTGHKAYVNDLRVADCKLIEERDHIRIGGAFAQLSRQVEQIAVTEGSDWLKPDVVCDWDTCGFNVGDVIALCPVCHAPHHQDCWRDYQERCAHCGYQSKAES